MWNPGPAATTGDDGFVGDDSGETVQGLAGDDVIDGQGGNDSLYGDEGDDYLMGGAGNDFLVGAQGSDLLEGGAGNDSLIAEYYGDDRLYGGDGDDFLSVYGGEGRIIVGDGGNGNDYIRMTVENDMQFFVAGGAGDDRIDFWGFPTNTASIILDAGDGDDVVSIEVDMSWGESLAVEITLGAGRDIIVFSREIGPSMTWTSPQVVQDFQTGDAGDSLDLYSLLLLDAPTWDRVSNPFATGYLRLVQDGVDTLLQVDIDGTDVNETWSDFYRFKGVAPGQFTAANFHGMAPDGGAAIGETINYPETSFDVRGTIGDDTITATTATIYYGRAGDDEMVATGTWVTFYGGAGDDHLVGDWSPLPSGPSGSTLYGESGADRLDGSVKRDWLYGGEGADSLAGGDDNDLLDGGAGNDTIVGGAGFDTVSYETMAVGVSVTIGSTTTILGGAAGVDTVSQVEAFLGSLHDDTITVDLATTTGYRLDGGEGDDIVTGGGGDDIIVGGYGTGADRLVGRGGADTLSYQGNFSVRVDLRVTTAQDTGGGGVDTVSGFKNLEGTWFDDILIGDGQDNVITGDAYSVYGEPVGKDTIQGGAGADLLIGGGGDDKLYGQIGNDDLRGGNGYDLLAGGDGNDLLDGGAGGDFMVGENGGDRMVGGAGDDVLDGGAGDDVIDGGEGDDTLTGADGLDVLTYASATQGVVVSLLAGGPQNTVGAGIDNIGQFEALVGSAHDDVLTGASVFGMDGADHLIGSSGADLLTGGLGDDWLEGGLGDDFTLAGEAGADLIRGGAGADNLYGQAGADRLYGDAGADVLAGGDDDDYLDGGGDNDFMVGEAGKDFVTGGLGNDFLDGGASDDILVGGEGVDQLFGQDGADTLFGGTGDDTLSGGAGDDIMHGELGDEVGGDDQMFGGTGGDVLLGGNGADVLQGEAGEDQLLGGAGGDTLLGGDGVDLLDGGAAADVLVGGAGADRFVYNDLSDSRAGQADRILDFGAGDILDLGRIDADTFAAGNQGFVMTNAFTFLAGEAVLKYDPNMGATWFLGDTDGDGAADFVLIIDGNHPTADPQWLL